MRVKISNKNYKLCAANICYNLTLLNYTFRHYEKIDFLSTLAFKNKIFLLLYVKHFSWRLAGHIDVGQYLCCVWILTSYDWYPKPHLPLYRSEQIVVWFFFCTQKEFLPGAYNGYFAKVINTWFLHKRFYIFGRHIFSYKKFCMTVDNPLFHENLNPLL